MCSTPTHATHFERHATRRNATQVASHNLQRATAASSAACAINLAVTSSSCALSFALSLKRPSSVYTKSPSFQSCRRAGACMQYRHHTHIILCRICVVWPCIVPRIRRSVHCMRRAVAGFRAACQLLRGASCASCCTVPAGNDHASCPCMLRAALCTPCAAPCNAQRVRCVLAAHRDGHQLRRPLPCTGRNAHGVRVKLQRRRVLQRHRQRTAARACSRAQCRIACRAAEAMRTSGLTQPHKRWRAPCQSHA